MAFPWFSRLRSLPIFLILLALYSVGYLWGVQDVPFHPDESTQLFTSGDIDIFLNRPADLYWRAENEGDIRQRYRELDAPLTHSIIAIGRWIAGLPALPVDWDWGKTWQENQQAGALPSPDLLLAGRMAEAALFPFSVLFLFLTARRTAGSFTAWVAALLLACNVLALLHTRRAMAEGGLLFTLTLTLWMLVKAERRPWLTAIPTALAFCAKQTLAALAPVGFLAVLLSILLPVKVHSIGPDRRKLSRLSGQTLLFAAIFAAVILLLHPFLWGQPVSAIQAAIHSRQALASAQTTDRPEQVLNTPGRRLIGLIGSVYFTPPAFAEAGNYLADTRASETTYLANPLNSLFRSLPAGGILLIAGLFGFVLGALRAARVDGSTRRGLLLLLTATLFQTLALLLLIPLPWQRYYLPVVPFACLWAAYGVDQIKELVMRAAARRTAPAQLIDFSSENR